MARQWRLIKAIASANQGITAAQLAKQEEVELRTVYRDIQTLQDAGFPLYGKKEGRSTKWSLVDSAKGKGLPAPYTVSEIISLWLAQDMLSKLPDRGISQTLDSLFSKITASLAQGSLAKLSEIKSSFTIVELDQNAVKELEQKIDLVNQMVLAKKRLQVSYQQEGVIQELLLDPYRTWHYENQWYVMAYCHQLKGTHMLLIENIEKMRLIDEDSTPDPNFDLGDFMRNVCNQVIQDKLKVKIKVSPIWQEWFGTDKGKTPLHGKLNEDGSLEVEMNLGNALVDQSAE